MLPFHFWYQRLQEIYSSEESKAVLGKFFTERTGRSLAFWMGENLEEWEAHRSDLENLCEGRPVQYVLGYEWFGPLRIGVNSSVLIPRPETWELVEWASEQPSASFLDLCTGSGCIALALSTFYPHAKICGIDLSSEALETAQRNRDFLKVSVNFQRMDVLTENPPHGYETWISNPPYVGLDEKSTMEKNVLDFEPEMALFSEDPNRFYFRIVQLFLEDATAQTLFFELNPQHVEEVQTEVLKHDLHWETRTDFRGKMRMAKIRKS